MIDNRGNKKEKAQEESFQRGHPRKDATPSAGDV